MPAQTKPGVQYHHLQHTCYPKTELQLHWCLPVQPVNNQPEISLLVKISVIESVFNFKLHFIMFGTKTFVLNRHLHTFSVHKRQYRALD